MDVNGGSYENDYNHKWKFQGNKELNNASIFSIRSVINLLTQNIDGNTNRPMISLAIGDPTGFKSYRTTSTAVDAVVDSVRSFDFNSYSPTVGVLPARRAIAQYLSQDLPHQLSPDDVYLTAGCTHAIEVVVSVLGRPGANILVPKPCYQQYEARAAFNHLEVRHYNLIPEKGWEVDVDGVEALADDNTAAIVIINPGNPCGNVFKYQHMKKIAETARKLGIFVISDEVYGHLVFGSNPFVAMGEFASIVPVLTLGSISKRWIVPGWRLGWIVKNDPSNIFNKTGIAESIKNYLDISSDPATIIQGAIPQILEKTNKDFFSNIIKMMKEAAEMLYERIKAIPGLTLPHRPQGSMAVMVKLELALLENISSDLDFCLKLAKEECLIILPGVAVGLNNWVRITFAVELPTFEDGLGRLEAFCQRHAKKQN
ncbi:hypothetical protein FNV43_RR13769 [Rhamnella rubrinervis]|uniref:Aminotransferase class I/classII large domain-containing protein n=1 Tax=Rhamnella rubrinervis TaxID=2594499 RepID=A0A8K0MES7_9ROSA|nr:hypothetical protein FNV43_RR13769 [Rhamnella rubrinervis]